MVRPEVAMIAGAALALTACSSSTNPTTAHPASTTPETATQPRGARPVSPAANHAGVTGTKAAAIPTAGPVTTPPLGGYYCDPTAANWTPTTRGIQVHVHARGPSDIAVYVLDATNNPIGNAVVQIGAGTSSAQLPINVPNAHIARVSLAISGTIHGICAVQQR